MFLKKNIKKNKKIAVAMSGGLDSSITATLLKKEGFLVAGVFMKLWPHHNSEDEKRAEIIADILEIPFHTIDLKNEFKKKIVNNFIKDYQEGKTPNPCVNCNKMIKLGILLDKVLAMGFDFMATGHYARKIETKNSFELLKGLDKKKDQSYFLWKLNQGQLQHLLFPLGNYTKDKVRKMAENYSLPLLGIKESMEVCFIKNSVKDFLKEYLGENPGDIVNKKGDIMGRHLGLWFYTIGQRKRIGLSGGPYFVIKKDYKNNLLIISKDKKDLKQNYLKIKDVNWISGKAPIFPIKANIQIRYRGKEVPVIIHNNGNFLTINFNKPQLSIAPGQSAVLYKKEKLLGGGVIIL